MEHTDIRVVNPKSTSEHQQKADCTDSIVPYFLSSQVCSSTPESSDRPDIHPESRACLLRSLWEREQHSVHFCATSTSQFQMAKMPRSSPSSSCHTGNAAHFPVFPLEPHQFSKQIFSILLPISYISFLKSTICASY